MVELTPQTILLLQGSGQALFVLRQRISRSFIVVHRHGGERNSRWLNDTSYA